MRAISNQLVWLTYDRYHRALVYRHRGIGSLELEFECKCWLHPHEPGWCWQVFSPTRWRYQDIGDGRTKTLTAAKEKCTAVLAAEMRSASLAMPLFVKDAEEAAVVLDLIEEFTGDRGRLISAHAQNQ